MSRIGKKPIIIPESVNVAVIANTVSVKGPKGELKQEFSALVRISKEENKIVIKGLKSTKREGKLVRTFGAHIKNMLKGANETYQYKLKICSGHFPMNVSVKDKEFIVKNFFGEKIPRVMKIKDRANVKVEGDMVIVESPDKEGAGQVAADIEQLMRRTKYDTRIFQDGCWIFERAGKEIK